jgi:hypothetical protein
VVVRLINQLPSLNNYVVTFSLVTKAKARKGKQIKKNPIPNTLPW